MNEGLPFHFAVDEDLVGRGLGIVRVRAESMVQVRGHRHPGELVVGVGRGRFRLARGRIVAARIVVGPGDVRQASGIRGIDGPVRVRRSAGIVTARPGGSAGEEEGARQGRPAGSHGGDSTVNRRNRAP